MVLPSRNKIDRKYRYINMELNINFSAPRIFKAKAIQSMEIELDSTADNIDKKTADLKACLIFSGKWQKGANVK